MATKVTSVKIGLQSGTDRTVYATWKAFKRPKGATHGYNVKWYYGTGNGVWFIGNETSVTATQSTYSAPSNAVQVKVIVQPYTNTTVTVKNKKSPVWTAGWSTAVKYSFSSNPPSTPSVPNISISDFKLTVSVDNYDSNCTSIEFQIVKNDRTVVQNATIKKTRSHASYTLTVAAGNTYKVRCRGVKNKKYSSWSEYSNNVSTKPSAPTKITSCKALSETSVRLEWGAVSNATEYEIEYTTNKDYFDSSSEPQNMTVNAVVHHAEVTGLDSGNEWFFRLRAKNDQGESGWTPIVSTVIGKAPTAPTTWSSTVTAIAGEVVYLYWVHNSEDGSDQKNAEIRIKIGTSSESVIRITNNNGEAITKEFKLETSKYTEGTIIKWRVRTRGILASYSDWSVERTITVYAPPVLEFNDFPEVVESFPIVINADASPNSQNPIGYYLTITANETYETVDFSGRSAWVSAGDEVYSKYIDDTSHSLSLELGAGDVNLVNNEEYTITCVVAMSSGLTAEQSIVFSVEWGEVSYDADAEIIIDEETVSAYIRPYCEDEDGNLIEDILLSVYRREYDGSFTELARNLENTEGGFITDPHPALDYARYRIVAMDKNTGSIDYYDPPGVPVGETAIIIQWDEEWSSFDIPEGVEEDTELPAWSGSMLKLPYNIDVADSHSPDVTLAEYIGRKHPVAYYGTQLGATSTWNCVIERDDEETLYGLRRLAIWMGAVYVREPSGSGYWAQINVSFSQKHLDLTIPVTLSIKRVDGGV